MVNTKSSFCHDTEQRHTVKLITVNIKVNLQLIYFIGIAYHKKAYCCVSLFINASIFFRLAIHLYIPH